MVSWIDIAHRPDILGMTRDAPIERMIFRLRSPTELGSINSIGPQSFESFRDEHSRMNRFHTARYVLRHG